MKFKLKKKYIAAAAVNAAAAAGILALSIAGNALINDQSYNQASAFWSDSKDFTQMSGFFDADSPLSTDSLNPIRKAMMDSLENVSVVPEEGQELIADAYSTPLGSYQFLGAGSAYANVEVTAVGGHFFLFRDFILMNGGYISDSDLRQDGVVISENLAWTLFGSTDIAGMTVTINNKDFYVSGVISEPSSKLDKKTAGDSYRAYISYSGADMINSESNSSIPSDPNISTPTAAAKLKDITCYECIMPSPVKNYAYNSFKDALEKNSTDKYETVNNTERFNARDLVRAFRKRSDLAIRDSKIILPYWENSSRIAEFKLSSIFFWRRICFIPLILTALWIIVRLWIIGGKFKRRLTGFIAETVNDTLYKLNNSKQKKDEISSENNA